MKALILIDIQNDFLPGGALAVAQGDAVVPIANRLQEAFELIVATQDWHPREHGSFAVNHPGRKPADVIKLAGQQQVLWPVHCVQRTRGAEFSTDLKTSKFARVFTKGTDASIDSYSGFFDNGHRKATGLGDYLKSRGATDLYLAGLATEYCVKFTALDARAERFNVYLVKDACRGVNLRPGDSTDAIAEMQAAGVHIVQSAQVMAEAGK